MIHLKTPDELADMRAAGQVVREILDTARAVAVPGATPADLDAAARDVLARRGARSPFLHYRPAPAMPPFPAVLCVSVNDAVLHGIPGSVPFADGDLVSVDAGATLGGWTGDAAVTFPVGTPRPADIALVRTAEQALAAGIGAAVVGGRIGDISAAIGAVVRSAGYQVNTDYGGHGIGRTMHEAPAVPNDGRPGRGFRLQPGLTLAIEPWFLAGGRKAYRTDGDGWTLRSTDGSRTVHVEQTVAVTPDGPVVLTA
ncbi:type I methionyl aminopeptidase [Nakamurella endophytica]|uniref:Methionine aminopeptidase n=1 Tax=Nakamurella endophytica TaxID=1748367 RepID=A0A917WJJ3_9ACTN|nr:type I methionyl aminopeptidase [Nakamurella endophytica]GGM10681.1 methionine aminopeptidase [Nakamurella endophytica]